MLRRVIAVEQIYDAAFDDEALRGLAVELATALDARSALIHWIHDDGSADVLAHSGYFSDEQLALYGREFAAIDPWVGATSAPGLANRVLDLEAVVPVKVFAASDFYNDYVRSMGDDTARCIGVRLKNGHGSGFIALQRGVCQAPFATTTIARLQNYSGHLMRMLAMRGRLVSSERRSGEIAAALDGIGRPAFLVDASLRLRHANSAAERLLRAGKFVTARDGLLGTAVTWESERLRNAVEQVMATGEATAMTLGRRAGPQIELSVTTVPNAAMRLALILVSGAIENDTSRSTRLRAMYGLSASEAALAGMLADGMSLAEIAERRRVAIGTVRFQIKQIAFKLGCHRQSEIVRVVSSLPPLSSGSRIDALID